VLLITDYYCKGWSEFAVSSAMAVDDTLVFTFKDGGFPALDAHAW
jgi:hypothetical protein